MRGRIVMGKSAVLSNTTLYSLNIVNINLSLDKDSIKRKSVRVVPSVKMHTVSSCYLIQGMLIAENLSGF